jgi:hypothetical protein
MIIFRTDGKKIDTTELERFSVYEPSIWERFERTGRVEELENLFLYVPEKYSEEYSKAFKDYIKQINKDVNSTYDDPIRETRKEAGTIRTY